MHSFEGALHFSPTKHHFFPLRSLDLCAVKVFLDEGSRFTSQLWHLWLFVSHTIKSLFTKNMLFISYSSVYAPWGTIEHTYYCCLIMCKCVLFLDALGEIYILSLFPYTVQVAFCLSFNIIIMATGLTHRTKMCTWRAVMCTVTRLLHPAVSLSMISVAKHHWLSFSHLGILLVLVPSAYSLLDSTGYST